MTDTNAYLRRDDVSTLLRSRLAEIRDDVERMTTELAGTGDAEVGPLRKQYLAGQIAQGFAETEAVHKLACEIDGLKGFRYRSFTEYDGVTRYNSLVATDADRVPLDPEAIAPTKPATIGYTLTVTRKADGETRTRTGEMKAHAEGLRELWLTFAEGSLGSDCNHDILFDPSRNDDEPVDEPQVSAYTMELKLDDGTVIDLTSLVANLSLATRLEA
jgi:hypothetical protein